MGRKNRRIEERLSRLPTVGELRREKRNYIESDRRDNNRSNTYSSNKASNKSNAKYSNDKYKNNNEYSNDEYTNNYKNSSYRDDSRFNHYSLVTGESDPEKRAQTSICKDIDMPISRGSIWLATLAMYSGSNIQGGYRPVIVVSNEASNKYSTTITVVPLTSIIKRIDIPTHVLIPVTEERKLVKPTMVLAEQVMTIDKANLKKYLSTINDRRLMNEINDAIRTQLML